MKGRQGELPLDLEIFLCFAIYSASHTFNRIYQPLLDGLGLTYPQYIAMVLLWERDSQTVGELGRRLFLESNTVTPLLKRPEKLGHIKRRRDPADERQVRIYLTEAGRKLRHRAVSIPRCILDASGLDGREAKRLLERSARCARHSKATIPVRKIRNTDPVLIGFASLATTETRAA